MKLTINGESPGGSGGHGLGLLESSGLHPQGTVVERNREIVDRQGFRETRLNEGDILELVRLGGRAVTTLPGGSPPA